MRLKVEIDIRVNHAAIVEIMQTAFGGGINYWATEVKGVDLNTFAYGLGEIDITDEDGLTYSITVDDVYKGIEMYIEKGNYPYDIIDYYEREIDMCQIDADVADMIIQYACYGNVIYG